MENLSLSIFSESFKKKVLTYCSENFFEENICFFKQEKSDYINFLDATLFLNDNLDSLNRVRFCLVWLQAITADDNLLTYYGNKLLYPIVYIDGMGYTAVQFTDFLCYLTQKNIITEKEHMLLTNEWLDYTEGKPYYE